MKSEVKTTTKDIVDHLFAVDGARSWGQAGGVGQPGGAGGLQNAGVELAAKSVEQLAGEYPSVASYIQGLSAEEIQNNAQDPSKTAVKSQMEADTQNSIVA